MVLRVRFTISLIGCAIQRCVRLVAAYLRRIPREQHKSQNRQHNRSNTAEETCVVMVLDLVHRFVMYLDIRCLDYKKVKASYSLRTQKNVIFVFREVSHLNFN